MSRLFGMPNGPGKYAGTAYTNASICLRELRVVVLAVSSASAWAIYVL